MNNNIEQLNTVLNKKIILLLLTLYFLFWYLNYCTPLIFDDYIYSFAFSENSMLVPFPETATRIEGFKAILSSQWTHYFSWGGRTVAHTLAQFFLWQGKFLFNFVNAACFVLLLLEICWIVNKGKVAFHFSKQDFLYAFGLLWIFSIGLGDVFVWLTLSCNYLWTTVLLLFFLIIYEHHYFFGTLFLSNKAILFSFGFLAGWTNENTVCFVILVLSYYFFYLHKGGNSFRQYSSLLYGFAGLCAGYLLLMLAPGNYVRFIRESQNGALLSGLPLLMRNLTGIFRILALRGILYGYVVKKIFVLCKCKLDQSKQKQVFLSCAFLVLSLSSICIMILSPEFRFRSSFPGLIFLIIATGLVRNISCASEKTVLENKENRFYRTVRIFAAAYVCITVIGSVFVYTLQRQQTQAMLAEIDKEKNNPAGQLLIVYERPYGLKKYNLFNAITGFHLVFPYSITADENYWINKDVALYYGIQSIRTEENEDVWRQDE